MHTSENDIKKAALAFLKTHYRYRPRTGEVQWKLDMMTPDGIIADGVFSFEDDKGSLFLATFEATSFLTREEVIYKFVYTSMIWDGLAIASVWATLVLSYALGADALVVTQWGIWGGIWRMLTFIIIVVVGYIALNRLRHRYRYIYAIEQFKRYHADEQWVAIGSDVFPNSDDPYLRELREQCIIYGFGLVSIRPNLDAQLLITPARHTLFGETRQAADFITESQWMQRFKNSRWVRMWNALRTGLPKVKQRLPRIGEKIQDGYQKIVPVLTRQLPAVKAIAGRGVLLNQQEFLDSLQRYRRGHLVQVLVTLLSFTIMGSMYFNELLQNELVVLDNKIYLDQKGRDSMRVEYVPEPTTYIIDTPYVASYGEGGLGQPIRQHTATSEQTNITYSDVPAAAPPNKQQQATQIISRDSSVPDVDPPVVIRPRPPSTSDETAATGVGIYIPDAPQPIITYDCARFFNFDGAQYFIQEGIYPTRTAAIDRIEDFAENGLRANYLWMGCFNEKSNTYAVFVDELTDDLIQAQTTARTYRELISEKMNEKRDMKVQMIQMSQ